MLGSGYILNRILCSSFSESGAKLGLGLALAAKCQLLTVSWSLIGQKVKTHASDWSISQERDFSLVNKSRLMLLIGQHFKTIKLLGKDLSL